MVSLSSTGISKSHPEIAGASAIRLPPLIKWPGGKRALLPDILPLIPHSHGRYYEPFLGGAALFFALRPQAATLSDTNGQLINLYRQVRDCPDDVLRILRTYSNSEEFYYRLRARACRSPQTQAARFLYLTKLSFNGIHRVNLKGEFNVPYGHKTHLAISEPARLYAASEALRNVSLSVTDFEQATASAKPGDVIYFDPPYTVAHAHNGFVKYNEKIFSWNDQVRLAKHARTLADSGCHVIVSNADHSSIAALYRSFDVSVAQRFSRIAASRQYRARITERIYYKLGTAR